MDIIALASVTFIWVAAMATLGVLWLRTLRELHQTETERDRYWDMCMEAGLIQVEPGEKSTHGS